jgi:hypothetical protein
MVPVQAWTKSSPWERDLITIKNWDRLVQIGEFDQTYLRMPKAARPVPA